MVQPRRRDFTLIELLIVIAIIGILATMLLTALGSARRRTQIGVAKSSIQAVKAALAMYEADMGRFPRFSPRPNAPTDKAQAYRDDAPALYAGLRNRATKEAGGGQNSPYLQDWKLELIGLLDASTSLDVAGSNKMGSDGSLGTGVEPLANEDKEQLNLITYQKLHSPGGSDNRKLVLLDPWGNPYHYREWASIRTTIKDNLMTTPETRSPVGNSEAGIEVVESVKDRPHNPEGYDIWSNGPNGVNEFGEGDDVTSWGK